jgi:hypothetical protein
VDPTLAIGPIGQVVNAARQKQQLDGYRDQVLIDALDGVSQLASQAAKAIVDEAEAILTKAEVCRLANDDDAYAVHVRIVEYFQNHPRLTTLQDSLEVLARLLEPLRDRAGRLLQLPKTKRARKEAVQRFLASATAMQEFVDSLFFEFRHLPARTGLAVSSLERIDQVMSMDNGEERLSYRGEVLAAVKEGRHEVQQSRLRRAAARLGTTMVEARTAFL